MNCIICQLSCFAFILALLSCASDLDYTGTSEEEMVNGFTVEWRKQIKPKQKACIRELLDNMVKVEGGTFVMGATTEQSGFARNNEIPLSYNVVSDFYICKYEVSDAQYKAIVGNPNDGTKVKYLYLSWADWKDFIEVLNDMTGLHFDFPTEAQWEYAARGGNQSKGYIYPGSNDINEVRSSSYIEGSSMPNELGIYNMADLKSEWCKDYYETYKDGLLYEDRYISTGKNHVVRGGNYKCTGNTGTKYLTNKIASFDFFGRFKEGSVVTGDFDYRYCRVSARSYSYSSQSRYIGCRLVVRQ